MGKELGVAIALEQETQSNTIRLEGAVDIGCAADLKAALLRALTSGAEVRIVFDGVTDLDVTAMQLIWAAPCAARESGVRFTLAGEMPASVASALADAGIQANFELPLRDQEARGL